MRECCAGQGLKSRRCPICLLVQAGGKLGLGGFRRRARVQLTSLPLLSPLLCCAVGHTLRWGGLWVTPSCGRRSGSRSLGCALAEISGVPLTGLCPRGVFVGVTLIGRSPRGFWVTLGLCPSEVCGPGCSANADSKGGAAYDGVWQAPSPPPNYLTWLAP